MGACIGLPPRRARAHAGPRSSAAGRIRRRQARADAQDDPRAIGPKQDDPHAIGPKQDDPHAIGPKQDDPHAIGPKQDDLAPRPDALGRRIHALLLDLAPGERGIVLWVLARAGRASDSPGRPGTPGGLEISLSEALLVEPTGGSGGKGGSGGPPGPVRARSWRLRV